MRVIIRKQPRSAPSQFTSNVCQDVPHSQFFMRNEWVPPPVLLCCSRMRTRCPDWASRLAVVHPPGPDPITIVSSDFGTASIENGLALSNLMLRSEGCRRAKNLRVMVPTASANRTSPKRDRCGNERTKGRIIVICSVDGSCLSYVVQCCDDGEFVKLFVTVSEQESSARCRALTSTTERFDGLTTLFNVPFNHEWSQNRTVGSGFASREPSLCRQENLSTVETSSRVRHDRIWSMQRIRGTSNCYTFARRVLPQPAVQP